MNKNQTKFLNAYVEALLWSSSVVSIDGEYEDADQFSLCDTAKEKCASDCKSFMEQAAEALVIATSYESEQYDYSDAGHDFALTRNRHGSGFWEQKGEVWDNLTALSNKFGEIDLFLNDDNQLDF